MQQVPYLLVVNLEKGASNRALALPFASFDAREDVLNDPRDHSDFIVGEGAQRRGSHRVRLAAARLAVRQHRGVVPVEARVHQGRHEVIVHRGLLRGWGEDFVEVKGSVLSEDDGRGGRVGEALARAFEALFGDEGTCADGDADGEVLRGGVLGCMRQVLLFHHHGFNLVPFGDRRRCWHGWRRVQRRIREGRAWPVPEVVQRLTHARLGGARHGALVLARVAPHAGDPARVGVQTLSVPAPGAQECSTRRGVGTRVRGPTGARAVPSAVHRVRTVRGKKRSALGTRAARGCGWPVAVNVGFCPFQISPLPNAKVSTARAESWRVPSTKTLIDAASPCERGWHRWTPRPWTPWVRRRR